MGYYYKRDDIKFSSYACVKHMSKIPGSISGNEVKLFNNCIKIITTHERHLTESTIDGFDTYFFGVLIHRNLDKNAYDIYCSSKSYAYFVIKYLHNVAHDDYEKIYTIIRDKIDDFQKWLLAMPHEEQVEFKANFEKNFRIQMINELSQLIQLSVNEATDYQNKNYVATLMGEIVNTIIQTHAQEEFKDVSNKKLLAFMEYCEQGHKNIVFHEKEFLTEFFSHLTRRYAKEEGLASKVQKVAKKKGYQGIVKYEVKDDFHIFDFSDRESASCEFNLMVMKSALAKYNCIAKGSNIKIPTLAKRIQDKLKENISPEKIRRRTVTGILQSKEEKIKRILFYTDMSIDDYADLNINYKTEYLSIIELILKQFAIAFIGEKNINLYHQRDVFYKAIEEGVPL